MDHLSPRQALQLLQTHPDALFIDCRSEMEYLFVGHPVGALHIPWSDGPDGSRVPNVERGFEGELDEQRHRTRAGWRFEGLPC
jgi:rhodanese-related sulfurtransferase